MKSPKVGVLNSQFHNKCIEPAGRIVPRTLSQSSATFNLPRSVSSVGTNGLCGQLKLRALKLQFDRVALYHLVLRLLRIISFETWTGHMMQHGEIIPIKMKMKLFPRIAGYGVDNDGKFTISVRDFTRKRGLSARLNIKGRMADHH